MQSGRLETPNFAVIDEVLTVRRMGEHQGVGPISFRRMLDGSAFESPIDFVDVTTVPPGSTIGSHAHDGTEEIYIILSGTPLVEVDGDIRRLAIGDVAVVRSGGSHSLTNDTSGDVFIGVVQVRI
jgi:oxalate decarboxylase/phosphoglucose isomerase-like protein (cupin superfamily)